MIQLVVRQSMSASWQHKVTYKK